MCRIIYGIFQLVLIKAIQMAHKHFHLPPLCCVIKGNCCCKLNCCCLPAVHDSAASRISRPRTADTCPVWRSWRVSPVWRRARTMCSGAPGMRKLKKISKFLTKYGKKIKSGADSADILQLAWLRKTLWLWKIISSS